MGFFDDMQKTIFFQNDANSTSAQQMRQKIALAMLMKKSAAPKNLGEGLYSVGDSLADAYMGKSLEREAADYSAKTDAAIEKDRATAGTGVPPATPGPRADISPLVPGDETATADVPGARTAAAAPAGVSPNAASWHAFATRPYDQGGLGVTPAQAAGVVGNLQRESSPAIKPVGLVGDNGTAFGAAQWRGDRYANLNNFARANGMDPTTTEAQQAFMRHEMRGSGQYGGGSEARAFAALSGAQDPSSAATAFNTSYERSADRSGRREAAAQQLARVMADPSATPRDRVAAVANAQAAGAPPTAATPPTPSDTAQEARLADVTGMSRPAATPAFAPTASLQGRTGDVQSDAPPVTGALQGPLGQAVGDTVQQRQETFGAQPAQPVPPPGGNAQVAQAAPSVFPPVASDVKPILPGGGFPQVAPQIQTAPPDQRAAVRTAPRIPDEYVPPEKDPQPEPPAKPGMGPIEQDLTRRVLNADVDLRRKAAAQSLIDAERQRLAIPYENQVLKYKADIANWQKRQEQTLGYQMGLPKQRAETENQYATTAKTQAETPKAQAESDTAVTTNRFFQRTGREREPFLKEFAADKEQISKVVPMLRDTQIAREALDSGYVTSGFGADAKFNVAKIAAKIGSQDAQKIANESEKYQKAMDRTIAYGIMLVNGKDPRVSEGDVAQAKGLQGTPDMQEASKRKIIDIMQSDIHNKIDNYEGLREQYLRGDPQHRFFKVDVPNAGVSNPEGTGTRDILLKNPTNQGVIQEFDRIHGSGAAKLEINRAKRRMNREDD